MAQTQSLEEIAKAAASLSSKRAMHVFTVPASLRDAVGVSSIGMVELTPREQGMASKRGGLDPMAIANEYAKESLREVNGKPVNAADGSIDAFWEKAHPKLRTLITTAYDALHMTTNQEASDFLKSKEVVVR